MKFFVLRICGFLALLNGSACLLAQNPTIVGAMPSNQPITMPQNTSPATDMNVTIPPLALPQPIPLAMAQPTPVLPSPQPLTPAISPAPAAAAQPIQALPSQPLPVSLPAALPSVVSQPPQQPTPIPPSGPTQAAPVLQGQLVTPVKEDSTQEANIYLNFEKATLASVVNYLGEQKKINIIPNKDLENITVSLSMRTPLTMDRAWNVLLTLLESNGFSMINVDSIYRIVSNAANGQEVLPTYSSAQGVEPEQLPDSDLVVRYVYFLKNLKTETVQIILSKMINNPDKNIVTNRELNICIIKDQCFNIKAAMKIIKELDGGGLRETIQIIPLRWASADTIKALFDPILGADQGAERTIRFTPTPQQKQTSYFSQDTKILTDPVKNTLILLGNQKSIDRIKEFIYKYLDVPIDDAASRLHVKALRYVKAQDIAPILKDVIVPPKSAQATEKTMVMAGGFKVFEDVIITAEADDTGDSATKRGGGNRLVIAANRDDWRRLEDFIDKIDKPQPQVAIEVMVVDADKNNIRALGAQLYDLKGKPPFHNGYMEFYNLSDLSQPSDPSTPRTSYAKIPEIQTTNSPSYLTFGAAAQYDPITHQQIRPDNIWSIIKAIMKTDNTQIISQPYVIANNNQQCQVTSSKTKMIPGDLSGTQNVNPVRSQVQWTTKLDVLLTPNINLSGTVDLAMEICVDEEGASSNVDQPDKFNRKIKTKVSMGTGEVLVLGGLTKSQQSETVYKTPILGDIPILGNLFKYKNKTKTERNLYLFIRPSIIKPRFEGAPDEYTQLKLDYAKFQIMKNDTYVKDRDPIQRWFFKPEHQTIKHRLQDAAKGNLKPIDNFAYGMNRPRTINMQEDPYFRVSESIEQARAKREAIKQKELERERRQLKKAREQEKDE